MPGYTWLSDKDATGFLPGWECRRIEKPFGSTWSQWATGWKLIRLIEGLPF